MINEKRFLFEVSWEVCNKVGGINTVIKSKIEEAKKIFGDNYCLIGPMFEHNPEFYEEYHVDYKNLRERLKEASIHTMIGRWKAYGNPRVILVDYTNYLQQDQVLYQLWENFSVDSMAGSWDYLEPVLFSTMAGKIIEQIALLVSKHDIMVHFHEWITGAGLLYLKMNVPNIALTFTSHATVLGRTMAGNGIDIYNMYQNIDSKQEAIKNNVTAKHSLESISAIEADCFTTVSEITAMEAKHILYVNPDIILPNGFNVDKIPDYDQNINYYKTNREKLLKFASQFLMQDLEKNTIIMSTSGRYEFHNKGMDLIIESLGKINEMEYVFNKEIIMFFFIIGGFVDMSKERAGEKEKINITYSKYSMISTHPLGDPYHDPIVNECHKMNLQNNTSDKVKIIYVPVFLNGRDGVLNMEYYDALSGCDLTIYPSFYEPWGYTPFESAAYSIPTVSSDVSGFGKWIISNKMECEGIKILKRFGVDYNESIQDLTDYIISFIQNDIGSLNKMRISLKKIAQNAKWETFYQNYLTAYDIAAKARDDRISGKTKREEGMSARARKQYLLRLDPTHPKLRHFAIKPIIPDKIKKLKKLASNIWWSWDTEATQLFEKIDPELYKKSKKNAVDILELIGIKRLNEIISDEDYMSLYQKVITKFDNYLSYDKPLLENIEYISKDRPVAYFSMEFGFHESMPLYSGGLGILSGDHIKSASDLNLPLIGVGLFYKNGYFKQIISKDGEQIAKYDLNNANRMPLKLLTTEKDETLVISVDMPGRTLYAQIWDAQIGRITVYLLDTDMPMNSFSDRDITAKLYGGGSTTRIEQEILLGIGGVRLLENKLNIHPSVYHLNEGHSAFLIIERLINLMKNKSMDIDCAKEVIKASTVFTTHTPVAAGNESFDISLVENYFKNYIQSSSLYLNEFFEMGHRQHSDSAPYEMTVLALKNSYKRNGVSRLHSIISREMWSDLWKRFIVDEVPIQHITNGVHVPTWLSDEMKEIFIKHASINLDEALLKKDEWNKISSIPDEILWDTHLSLKKKLFEFIKEKITNNWEREGESPHLLDKFLLVLNHTPLTIGFARRFATYKRATLFLRNPDRMRRILLNEKYPVQFVFAGKAHPADKQAHMLIKEIIDLSKKQEFLGKIIFLEDYDINMSRKLIAGVDIWLNNPRRPLEASGTSGQKAAINGVINASVLDGWWDEAYNSKNGWAIGGRNEYKNIETQDIADSNSFYDLLENKIIPAYYSKNNKNIPQNWVKIMKESIITVISEFNTHRMLRDYVEKMYEPASKRYIDFIDNNFEKTKEVVKWKKSIKNRFASININDVSIDGISEDTIDMNDEITVFFEINRGDVSKDELKAEMVVFQDKNQGESTSTNGSGGTKYIDEFKYLTMNPIEETGSKIKYMCKFKGEKSGKYKYGIRILPYFQNMDDIIDLNLVYWG